MQKRGTSEKNSSEIIVCVAADDIVKHLRIIKCRRSDYTLLRIRYWQRVQLAIDAATEASAQFYFFSQGDDGEKINGINYN